MKFGDFIPHRQWAATVSYAASREDHGQNPNRRSKGIKAFTHFRSSSKISIHSLSTPLVFLDGDSDNLPNPTAVDSPNTCSYGSRLVEHLGGASDSAIPEEPENDEGTTATLISEGDSLDEGASVGFHSIQVMKVTIDQESDTGHSVYETLVNNDSFEFWDDVPASPASTVKPQTRAIPVNPKSKSKRKPRCIVPTPTHTPVHQHFTSTPLWSDQNRLAIEQRLADDLTKVESLENAEAAIDTMYEWLEAQMEAKFEQNSKNLEALRKWCEALEERVDELKTVNHGLKAAVETLSGEKTALMRDVKRIENTCRNFQQSATKRQLEDPMQITVSNWHGVEYGPGYPLTDYDESNTSGSCSSESSMNTSPFYYEPAAHPQETPEANMQGRSSRLLNRRRCSSNSDILLKGKKIAVKKEPVRNDAECVLGSNGGEWDGESKVEWYTFARQGRERKACPI